MHYTTTTTTTITALAQAATALSQTLFQRAAAAMGNQDPDCIGALPAVGALPLPKNALTHHVADTILADMYEWYYHRLDDLADPTTAWHHLHQVLFKKVRAKPSADLWPSFISVNLPHPESLSICRIPVDLGASEPEDGDGQPMVVSKEYVGYHLRELVHTRLEWLREHRLALDTLMNSEQRQAFLNDTIAAFHNRPEQLQQQNDDAEMQRQHKKITSDKKQRWMRYQQRCGGSTEIWYILSFTGCWKPEFLTDLAPVSLDTYTSEQQAKVKEAAQATAKVRQAKSLAKLRDELRMPGVASQHVSKGKGKAKGKGKGQRQLTAAQRELLVLYDNGTLQDEAKAATLAAGRGRFKRRDGSFVDIGDSTGGYLRTVL